MRRWNEDFRATKQVIGIQTVQSADPLNTESISRRYCWSGSASGSVAVMIKPFLRMYKEGRATLEFSPIVEMLDLNLASILRAHHEMMRSIRQGRLARLLHPGWSDTLSKWGLHTHYIILEHIRAGHREEMHVGPTGGLKMTLVINLVMINCILLAGDTRIPSLPCGTHCGWTLSVAGKTSRGMKMARISPDVIIFSFPSAGS